MEEKFEISYKSVSFVAGDLISMLERKEYASLRELFSKIPSVDIACLCDGLPEKYLAPCYRLLPKEIAAEVFVEMDAAQKMHLINSFFIV